MTAIQKPITNTSQRMNSMRFLLLSVFALAPFAVPSVLGVQVAELSLKARTDKENPIDYAVNEPIRFDFFLDCAGQLPEEVATNTPLAVTWTRTGDDGVKKTGRNPISLESGFSLTNSLAVPGFIRIQAKLVGANNKAYSFYKSNGDKFTDFEFGAGVDTRKIRLSTVEPGDFDAFWAEAKAKLATVPFEGNVELVDVTPSNQTGRCTTYAVKIPCYGPRPVTGWLIVPKNAAPGTLDVRAVFDGYGMIKAAPSPPTYNSGNSQIRFNVNAHGYDLVGKDDQYYLDMYNTLYPTNRKSYALEPSDYDNPTNTYFYYMAMRVMRAFDYLKSRPEWNGRVVIAEGGSQGGLQTMWAGGLVEGISELRPSVTWCCDLGNPFPKTDTSPLVTKGWGVPSVPNAYYFDAALHAKRVPETCTAKLTRLGMGDYTCPPRGVLLSYYLMKCPATAVLVQGSTHSYTPAGTNQTYTLSKSAGAGNFSNVDVYDAAGCDWTNHVVTVTGLPAQTAVSVSLSAVDGSPLGITATATSDTQGMAIVNVPTVPGVNYAYTIFEGSDAIGAGNFFAGGWDADGAWFRTALDGHGGAIEVNGTWTTPPTATNATAFVANENTAFTLSAAAQADGSGKLVRTEAVVAYSQLSDDRPPTPDATFANSLAVVGAVTNATADGPSTWMAYVGGTWRTLSGDIAPATNTTYVLRMEGDFTPASPRVRLSVSDDGGDSFALLADAATGAEWLEPTDAAKRALGEVATRGPVEIGALHGEFSNAGIAFAGDVAYASLADALASGEPVTLLSNATWPTNAPAGTVVVNRGSYALVLVPDAVSVEGNTVVVSAGLCAIAGAGTLRVNFGDLARIGIATAGRTPAQIAAALLETGANGIPKWQSYVLGLNPADASSLPLTTISLDDGEIAVSTAGIDVNEDSGATVTYRVYEVKDLSDPSKDESLEESTAPDDPAPIAMDGSDSRFFRIRVSIDLP